MHPSGSFGPSPTSHQQLHAGDAGHSQDDRLEDRALAGLHITGKQARDRALADMLRLEALSLFLTDLNAHLKAAVQVASQKSEPANRSKSRQIRQGVVRNEFQKISVPILLSLILLIVITAPHYAGGAKYPG